MKRELEDIIRRLCEIAEELGEETIWGDAYASELDEVIEKLEALASSHGLEAFERSHGEDES